MGLKNGITLKMKIYVDIEIHSFNYIKHNNVLRGKKRLENILKALIIIVKFIHLRGIFCRDLADFFP